MMHYERINKGIEDHMHMWRIKIPLLILIILISLGVFIHGAIIFSLKHIFFALVVIIICVICINRMIDAEDAAQRALTLEEQNGK